MFNKVPFTTMLSSIVDNRGKTCPTTEIGIPLIATNCVKNTKQKKNQAGMVVKYAVWRWCALILTCDPIFVALCLNTVSI